MIQATNWKRLAQKSANKTTETKRSASKKYDPRKESPTLSNSFLSPKLGQSFSKNHHSFIQQRRDHNVSKDYSQGKQSNSQRESSFQEFKKENYLEKSKVQETLSKVKKSDVKNISGFSSAKNQYALVQLERLKKQFNKFKEQIWKELQKQQKLIQKLIYEAVQEYTNSTNSYIKKQKKGFNQTFTELKHNPYITPRHENHKTIKPSQFILKNQKTAQGSTSIEQQNDEKKFTRFFSAMNDLRKGLKDLETLSEIDSMSMAKGDSEIRIGKNSIK